MHIGYISERVEQGSHLLLWRQAHFAFPISFSVSVAQSSDLRSADETLRKANEQDELGTFFSISKSKDERNNVELFRA
jgi:hypothetical protein